MASSASTSAAAAAASSSSSRSSPEKRVLVLDQSSLILYRPCNLCTAYWKTEDVIVRHKADGTAYHLGCYKLEHGRQQSSRLHGIDSLTDDQRNNAIGKAAAEFQNFYDWQAAPILPLTSSKTEARENCDSCSRILKNEFFRGSNTASVIMTQISHFNILIEDESMFQSLGAASKGFKVSILNMIVRTMLQIASASSKHTHWSNRSVAMVAALFAKRIDSEFGIGFEAANEDTTLKEIELFLLEEGTRESMRAAVTGALRNDTLVMEKFPPVDSMPDNHLIISPKWVATMYEEMEKIFREKFASDKKIGGASLESSLWSICGVIDAGATRQLGKFKPPPKPRAKRTDAAASTSENDQLNVAIEGEAAEKDKRVDSKNSKKASAGGKGRGTARPEPSTSKKQTKKKTNAVPDASRQEVEEEIEGQEEKEEALENPSTTLQQLQPTNTLASRRPSRAAARAAGARVAVMAVDSLAFQAEQAMQASTTRKRARDGNAMPTEPVQSTTSPLRAVRLNAPSDNSPAVSPSKKKPRFMGATGSQDAS